MQFRRSPKLDDRFATSASLLPWGQVIRGTLTGDDEWLEVTMTDGSPGFLPFTVSGSRVLINCGSGPAQRPEIEFTADNSQLRASVAGLQFRTGKVFAERDPCPTSMLLWGQAVKARCVPGCGTAWAQVGDKFLPLEVQGQSVLSYATGDAAAVRRVQAESKELGEAALGEKGKVHVELGTELRGWDLRQVTAAERGALQAMLATRPSDKLGEGRDVALYSRKYQHLELHAAWSLSVVDREGEYVARRNMIARECKRLVASGHECKAIRTKLEDCSLPDPELGPLDAACNEKWFLHGTKPENVMHILYSGLNGRLSSGLFGSGCYLAEDAAKIDQYTTPDIGAGDASLREMHAVLYPEGGPQQLPERLIPCFQPGRDEDVFYAFVIRGVCGHAAVVKNAKADVDGNPVFATGGTRELNVVPGVTPSIRYHSLLAELGEVIIRFREFVIFNSSQVVESYLIAYRRV